MDGCLACDLAAGRRPLPGGRIHETEHWLVEHCVGPLGVGTLVVKPRRHVVHVWELEEDEAGELGPLLQRVSATVAVLTRPEQVYACLWSHAGGQPVHVHFVVQPVTRALLDEYGEDGPALQLGMFERAEPPPEDEVAMFASRARDVLAAGQYHFVPHTYLELIRDEVPAYDELQDRAAQAVAGVDATRFLELGLGTGETAARILAALPHARLVGLDASRPMLDLARERLPAERVEELAVARLQDPLPEGPFDAVVSVLAVHHLDAREKRDLFARVADALRSGGVFVLGDVVVPERPEDAVTPLGAGFDVPDRADDQLAWLDDAGFHAELLWAERDLALIRAVRRD